MSKTTDGATLAQIKSACRELRLPSIGARTEATASEAAREHAGHLDFLAALLDFELEDRAERRRARRIADARFPRLKTLDDFQFADAPKLSATLIRELATASFVDKAENVILIGDSGTGKTHLATGIGIAACMQARKVRFTTTAALVNELVEARDQKGLSRVVARYARIDLLVLDELAYVPLNPAEAELLFQVLDERSETRSIVLTTNLPFGEWTNIFPEPRLCKAVVDRLTFHAHIIETGNDSWRFKQTVERRKGGTKKSA